MKILDRYTLRQVAGPLVWCLTMFLILYLVMDLFGHLDEILRFGVPWSIVARYYGAMLPLIFVSVAPFATLMAVLYAVGLLHKHQELTAMRASGVGPWRIVQPLVIVGLAMSTLVLLINERLVPKAAVTVHSLKEVYLERVPGSVPTTESRAIRSLTIYGAGHTLLYAKRFDPQAKIMNDVVLLEHGPDLKLRRKVTAERAEWTGGQWRLLNCTILRFGSDGRVFGKAVSFERKVIPGIEPPEVLIKAERQSQMMSSQDLKAYIARLGAGSREATRKLRVDLHDKLAVPFASLVIVLIAAPLAVRSGRGGTLLGMGTAIAVSLVFYGTHALLLALGKGGWLPPAAAAWGANLIFGGLGIWLLRRRLA